MLCRSHAATAVCVAGATGDDARAAAPWAARRAERPPVAVTRSMVAKSSKGTAAESGNRRRRAPTRRSPAMPAALPAGNSAAASADHVFQVVVMKVAIHCQGCARKVSKQLSKMEGVTSFSVDVESKRVTVMGHVSPAGVVQSVSRVKKAELWPALIS